MTPPYRHARETSVTDARWRRWARLIKITRSSETSMANGSFGGSSLRAALMGVALLALFGTPASARVGVTSATDGDPLGKPPTQNERVLRIGIDIQSDEVVTTTNNDRAHLVFLDGTSLTVGPNARVVIDKFVYDPT